MGVQCYTVVVKSPKKFRKFVSTADLHKQFSKAHADTPIVQNFKRCCTQILKGTESYIERLSAEDWREFQVVPHNLDEQRTQETDTGSW